MHSKYASALSIALTLTVPLFAACGRKAEPAEVTIALNEPQTAIASATILVDYSQAGAKPLVSSGNVSCATIVPNVTADFSDDGQGRLTIHARAPQGLSTPADLAVCRMVPKAEGTTGGEIASKLRISILDGTDMAGAPLGAQRVARGGEARHEQRGTTRETVGERAAHGEERLASREREREAGGQAAEEAPGTAPGSGRREAATGAGTAARPGTAAPAGKARPNSLMSGDAQNGEQAGSGESGGGAPAAQQDSGEEGNLGGGSPDANDEADTDRAARSYEVVVGVTNDAGKLGALQFDLLHSGSGGFAGAAGSARCSTQVPAALATFNDKGHGTLSGALIDLDGIPTPGAVASCTFRSREAVTMADFSVRVVDAAATDGAKPITAPQMGVVSMRAVD